MAVAAGAAVIAVASTTAWAAVSHDDSHKQPTALSPADAPTGPATGPAAGTPSGTPAPADDAPALGAAPAPTTTSPSPSASASASAKPTRSATAARKAAARKPRVISSGSCGASFYHEPQMTASGERFDPSAMTAAHKTLKLGSKVRVTNPSTGKSVTVRINDRGPYIGGRCLDLSRAAFARIGNTNAGHMRVTYEVLAR
ncbi:septal ring lytic transglycosylase RlpA family protein [Nonomuraea ceibae]|uniref:septal ring lytic transglycosylase RlpA family protein n=1 Tax=Nonomuraea ceibae TaxID=1935170 RepID=UPI001C5EF49A|nr:septal ring lytic transglycosylase RlpA family protein [Nonomuraea ceibae]